MIAEKVMFFLVTQLYSIQIIFWLDKQLLKQILPLEYCTAGCHTFPCNNKLENFSFWVLILLVGSLVHRSEFGFKFYAFIQKTLHCFKNVTHPIKCLCWLTPLNTPPASKDMLVLPSTTLIVKAYYLDLACCEPVKKPDFYGVNLLTAPSWICHYMKSHKSNC